MIWHFSIRSLCFRDYTAFVVTTTDFLRFQTKPQLSRLINNRINGNRSFTSYLFTNNRPLMNIYELRNLILKGEDVKGKIENPWIKSAPLRYSPNLSGSCSSLKWLVKSMKFHFWNEKKKSKWIRMEDSLGFDKNKI